MIDLKDPAFDLTKGEYIATQLMAALISKYQLNQPIDQDIVATMACELTQALRSELNRQETIGKTRF